MEDELEPGGSGDGGAPWMATFADMSTLLLTFFVLLLSFANTDIVKFQEMLGSVRQAFGVRYEHDGDVEARATTAVQVFEDEEAAEAIRLQETAILRKLNRAIRRAGLADVVEARQTARGVIVRMKGQILFGVGGAELKDQARPILDEVIGLFEESEAPILIEGHTDDLPISTPQYPSNWELSTARAIAAMRYFVEQGIPSERIGVAGYAGLRPIVPNDSEANRASNRRVEFVLVRVTSPEHGAAAGPASDEARAFEDAEPGEVMSSTGR